MTVALVKTIAPMARVRLGLLDGQRVFVQDLGTTAEEGEGARAGEGQAEHFAPVFEGADGAADEVLASRRVVERVHADGEEHQRQKRNEKQVAQRVGSRLLLTQRGDHRDRDDGSGYQPGEEFADFRGLQAGNARHLQHADQVAANDLVVLQGVIDDYEGKDERPGQARVKAHAKPAQQNEDRAEAALEVVEKFRDAAIARDVPQIGQWIVPPAKLVGAADADVEQNEGQVGSQQRDAEVTGNWVGVERTTKFLKSRGKITRHTVNCHAINLALFNNGCNCEMNLWMAPAWTTGVG